ncbi:AI-2E family transporter [Methanoregula sp.]|uniref:AI-2E family transporter n=1 Tax=Methanoregula sp. TaxID=2052170 RepID=UPI000CA835BE|nr:AI-2E family transporter [Methanoregula sp.]PKG33263.1 MAG: AI-2E family transporter [Methanoregula sp.]
MSLIKNEQFPFILMVILTVAAIILFWPVMDMVLLGASLAIVLMPAFHWLIQHARPVISAAFITIATFCAFACVIGFTLYVFSSNAETLTVMFSAIAGWINNPETSFTVFGFPLNKAGIISLLNTGRLMFVGYEETFIANLSYILFKAFIFFFTLFVLLLHGEELKRRIMEHMPDTLNSYVTRLSDVTVDTLYAIYVVQVAIAVLTFFIALPVFWLLGYGDVIFYAFFAAFCELVPILGSSIAFLLIGTYALVIGDIEGVLILFFLGYIVVSCMPEIFIRPVLVGRRVKIRPVIMFIGIVGGLLTMGLAGFVLGPVIVVLLITSYRMYVQDKKEMAQQEVMDVTPR